MYFPAKQDIALSRFSDGVASLTTRYAAGGPARGSTTPSAAGC